MSNSKPIYQEIASLFQAKLNCEKSNNSRWNENHTANINAIVEKFLPSGSGIDNGVEFDFESSKPERLVFTFGFHNMNENGMYCGWSYHKAIVTPSLQFGFNLRITGRDTNDLKSYLYDCFNHDLDKQIVTDSNHEYQLFN